MKRFCIKISLFLVLLILFTFGLFLLTDFSIKHIKQKLLSIRDDIKIVFAGDSGVECAVDNNLISNSLNIASSGEAYLYSYVKIKSLLAYNDQIDIIFLGFAYHDLLNSVEKEWLFNEEFVVEKIKTYYYLMESPEKSLIFKNNPKAYIKGILQSVPNNFFVYIKSFTLKGPNERIINYGGFKFLTRDKLQDASKKFVIEKQLFEKGLNQEKYLKMISELCHQESIKLVLLNTPKHKLYTTNIDKEIINNWLSVSKSLSQDSLLDLSTFILPDSCYGDLMHLNYKGAKIFSQYLNEKLH